MVVGLARARRGCQRWGQPQAIPSPGPATTRRPSDSNLQAVDAGPVPNKDSERPLAIERGSAVTGPDLGHYGPTTAAWRLPWAAPSENWEIRWHGQLESILLYV
ncbi:UNVERIFIED_CONTAM: hypothetical protein FKN15_007019 [Acipenser sinensis]